MNLEVPRLERRLIRLKARGIRAGVVLGHTDIVSGHLERRKPPHGGSPEALSFPTRCGSGVASEAETLDYDLFICHASERTRTRSSGRSLPCYVSAVAVFGSMKGRSNAATACIRRLMTVSHAAASG